MTRDRGRPDAPPHDGPGSPTAVMTGMNCVPAPFREINRGARRPDGTAVEEDVTVIRGTPTETATPRANGNPRSAGIE